MTSMKREAYARQARRKSASDISRFFGPELAVDLQFDRQTVAVVSEDVGRVEAHPSCAS